MANNIKVSDIFTMINIFTTKIQSDGSIMDPSNTFIAVILPAIDGKEISYNDFKEIYGFELFDPDIGVIKLQGIYIEEKEYTLPTVLDFMEMIDKNPQYDLMQYELCVDSEDSKGNHIRYHFGHSGKTEYRKIDDKHAYLILKPELNINIDRDSLWDKDKLYGGISS